jgi:hypothetical protein
MLSRARVKPIVAWLVGASLLGASCVVTAGPATAATTSLPSVFCDFEEPFRWVVLSPEGVLVEDHENGAVFTRFQPRSVRGSINSRLTITLPAASGYSPLVLEKLDQDESFSSHGVSFDGQEGFCDRLPTGFVLRKVVGVAEDDALNIRSAPNATAEILETHAAGELIWVKPTKNAWIQAAKAVTEDETPTFVVTGWVRSSFVTKVVPKIAHS